MMKQFNFNAATKAVLGAGLLSFALIGCGSDGDDGSNGEDGIIGVNIDSAKSVNAVFTSAKVENGAVFVDFKLEDGNGVAVLGLTKDHDLRFGIAQLTHEVRTFGEGEEAVEFDRGFQWQAYINAEKTPNEDWIPDGETDINPSNQFQANVEKASSCETCFVDNKDGTYSYTFQQNVSGVTSPVEVVYSAENTQRATLELELPSFAVNAHFDWQPSTGLTEDIQSRDVVSIDACYTCHQPDSIAFHGGRRIDLENCASCHTGTSGDPETGNSVDFTYMIHAIHKGDARTTYAPDSPDADEKGNIPAPYKVIGYGGGVHDYGKVMYPQKPAADCAACHVTGENAPADAELFLANQSNTACIACHTTMPKAYHDPSDENCISCHIEEGYARSGAEAHGDATKRYKASQDYSAKFSNIKVAGDVLTFDVQILNENGEPVAKEFIANPSKYTKSSVYFSWDTDKDYPAYTDGTKYSARGFALLNPDVSSYDPATKTFTIDSTKSALELPANLNGKSVELFAGVATCFKAGGYGRPTVEPTACQYDETDPTKLLTDAAYIQDAPLGFTWNDTDTSEPAKARRDIIDSSKCMGCHNQEIVHYDNGVNCQTCHTPDKGLNKWGGNVPTSFAYKAHHAEGHYLKYAGVGSSTVVKTDCKTCHTDSGIELGRSPDRAWRYGDADGNDIWVSSDAGACLSCHQKYLSDSGKAHITTNGGILDGVDAEDVQNRAKEACSTCHSPEKVMELHGH
ncbi:OmcA/MtrC family decaheme c-type cytochrome [Shewanella woodyi]|uniref:Decaheme cytochrome c n=1 Tax=Shewanella woodyi (strain ATCC 51908 / MS32) TaxID=392500 RepID=B1KML7_SHEWM|nr:OmcA/MtrC family decaheme c-type cytochrome [Shewanella woodyi]ACA87395.1 decaheme cytochrome c [Shewanella woodyi ATCC 51908]